MIHLIVLTGYLVLVDPNLISDSYTWQGETIPIRLKSAETIIALSQIRVTGVLLVAPDFSSLEARRREFSKTMKDVSLYRVSQKNYQLGK